MTAKKPLVVVVEDDAELNELERELLGVHGFRTMPAYTGLEAMRLCQANRVDAVLLDIMLPEMDGFETCCRLREQRPDHVPIVIVTALAEDAMRQRGFASGASAYFTKPFDPDEVVATLHLLTGSDSSTSPPRAPPRDGPENRGK